MTSTIPSGLQANLAQDVIYYQDDTSGNERFFYIPSAPQPDTRPDGSPDVTLETSGQGANLRLTLSWDISTAEKNVITQTIEQQSPKIASSQVSLQMGQLTNPEVWLTVGDGTQMVQQIGPVPANMLAPFRVTLNEALTAVEKSHALQAFLGKTGYLTVRYAATLTVSSRVKTAIAGDIVPALKALLGVDETQNDKKGFLGGLVGSKKDSQKTAVITREQCQKQLEASLSAGQLRLTRQESVNVPAQLRQKVDQAAKRKMVDRLYKEAQAFSSDSLPDRFDISDVSHEETDSRTYTVRRSADVGTWLKDSTYSEHVTTSLPDIPEPVRVANQVLNAESPTAAVDAAVSGQKVVRLGFDAQQAPLTEVKISWGGQSQSWRYQPYQPLLFPHSASGPLQIEVDYKKGDNFTHELTAVGDELIVTPAMLGLGEIIIDASAIQQENAKKTTINAQYKPDGKGSREQKQIYFYAKDDNWTQRWFVITRSVALNGRIDLRWTIIPASGGGIKKTLETTELNLRLTS